MGLGWVRRCSRAVAAILLLTSMLQYPHPSLDDELCSPAGTESHDESKHVFTPVTFTPHPGHCAICHWTRWVNPVFSSGPAIILRLDERGVLVARNAVVLRDPSAERLPSRAPPAL